MGGEEVLGKWCGKSWVNVSVICPFLWLMPFVRAPVVPAIWHTQACYPSCFFQHPITYSTSNETCQIVLRGQSLTTLGVSVRCLWGCCIITTVASEAVHPWSQWRMLQIPPSYATTKRVCDPQSVSMPYFLGECERGFLPVRIPWHIRIYCKICHSDFSKHRSPHSKIIYFLKLIYRNSGCFFFLW